MTGTAPQAVLRAEPTALAGRDTFHVLILDASHKHSLTSARSLARAGLRVALGESIGQFYPAQHTPPSFHSRYCARALVLPDYMSEPAAYVDAVVEFVREHQVRVVLPVGDANITLL